MSLVVLLHTGIIVSYLPVFKVVDYAVTICMMPLFFMISGFFTALSYQNRGARAVIADRTLRVALPCLVGLLVLNPFTNYFLYRLRVGPIDLPTFAASYFHYPDAVPSYLNWHLQMWFLVTLFVYVLLTPVLMPPVRKWLTDNRYLSAASTSPVLALFIIGTGVTLATVTGRSLHFLLFQRHLQGG